MCKGFLIRNGSYARWPMHNSETFEMEPKLGRFDEAPVTWVNYSGKLENLFFFKCTYVCFRLSVECGEQATKFQIDIT